MCYCRYLTDLVATPWADVLVLVMTSEILAQRLKTIRKARKIGRSKLAKLSGVTQRQIARIERGDVKFTSVDNLQLEQISSALQITQETLVGDIAFTDADLLPIMTSKCNTGCCG